MQGKQVGQGKGQRGGGGFLTNFGIRKLRDLCVVSRLIEFPEGPKGLCVCTGQCKEAT